MNQHKSEQSQVGDVLRKVSAAVLPCLAALREEFKGIGLVLLAQPPGTEMAGVMTGQRFGSREQTLVELEGAQRLMRAGAESTGRLLYQSPANPGEVAAESQHIREQSRAMADRYLERGNGEHAAEPRCGCPTCRVTAAATMIAAGAHLLGTLGVDDQALTELTGHAKEICRRAHLKVLESSARGSA